MIQKESKWVDVGCPEIFGKCEFNFKPQSLSNCDVPASCGLCINIFIWYESNDICFNITARNLWYIDLKYNNQRSLLIQTFLLSMFIQCRGHDLVRRCRVPGGQRLLLICHDITFCIPENHTHDYIRTSIDTSHWSPNAPVPKPTIQNGRLREIFLKLCGIIRLTPNSALVQHQFITNDDKDLRRHMAWLDQYLNDLLNVLTMMWRWGWPCIPENHTHDYIRTSIDTSHWSPNAPVPKPTIQNGRLRDIFLTPCGIIRLTPNSALVQHQFITNDDKDLRRHMAWLDQYLNDLLNVLTMMWRWGWPWGTRCGPGHTTVRAKEAKCKALTHNRARRIKYKIGVYITVANLKIE